MDNEFRDRLHINSAYRKCPSNSELRITLVIFAKNPLSHSFNSSCEDVNVTLDNLIYHVSETEEFLVFHDCLCNKCR